MKNKEKKKMLLEYGLNDKPEYLVNDLVAAGLGHKRYIQKLLKDGKIQAVKRGKSYYIPKDNLISYLRGERQFIPVKTETINEICMILDRKGYNPQIFFDELLDTLERGDSEL